MFKWLDLYAIKKGSTLSKNNSGGKYTFILNSKTVQNEI